MASQTVLTFANGIGKAAYDGIMVDIDSKPVMSFAFDSLYYEPETGLLIKIIANQQITLTNTEIVECECQAKRLVDAADFYVAAYSDDGIYTGYMLKSVAVSRGYSWTIEQPDHPSSRMMNGKWVRIVAVIMEDGTLIVQPSGVCPLCVIHLTQEEWNAFTPKPETPFQKWDFVKEIWYDGRDINDVKKQYIERARTVFEDLRKQFQKKVIPPYERETWTIQRKEAEAYLSDSSVDTPYIDVLLFGRTISKQAFCEDIVYNAKEMDKIHFCTMNAQYRFFDEIKAQTSLVNLDNLIVELSERDLSYASICKNCGQQF